jgi:fructoselysine 6-kinase
MRIVTVGDNCIDLYQASGKAYPGGNPVNVAVYLKGLGVQTAYIGWVGSDQHGDTMLEAIKDKGVDISHITRKKGRTAVTQVEMVGNDRRFGEYDEGVMAGFTLTPKDLHFIESFPLVHTGIWGRSETYFPLFKEMGLLTSFDFSDHLDHDLVKTLTPFVDYPFFSYTKDDAFIREFLITVKKRGPKIVLATLGENGSLAYDGEGFYQCEVIQTQVVDTMGAGDSFISGFLYGILKGLPPQKCLALGTETAAKTITYFGAW